MKIRYLIFICLFIAACGKEQPNSTQDSSNPSSNPVTPINTTPIPSGYDFETNGIPKFAADNYIELSKITRISKFRSGEGHDYSDSFEACRSMKHYYQPYSNVSWADVKIYSPVAGKIEKLDVEWAGTQVHIVPDAYPDFKIILFHVNLNPSLVVGSKLVSGQQIGTHIGSQTTSDITVSVNTTKGFRLISWFDIMTDALFDQYKNRGILTRSSVIISKADRDASPLSCTGEAFANKGIIENWVNLN